LNLSPTAQHQKHIVEYVKAAISFTDSLKARGYPLNLINQARHNVPSRQVLLEQLRTKNKTKVIKTSGARYKKFIVSGIQVPKIRGRLSLKSLTNGPAFKKLVSTKTWQRTFESQAIIVGRANPPNASKLMIRSLYAPKT